MPRQAELTTVSQVASPCIGICALDAQREYCTGCLRAIGEIRDWRTMSDQERLQVLQDIAARRVGQY
ncbi:DUF1289 domain-containing protein [Methylobacillus sp.]|uniref:DUF1289 domain-containing protein n=1 Tax=Methylobacillus sp. TaxID=56818 RepID=UPI002FE241CF